MEIHEASWSLMAQDRNADARQVIRETARQIREQVRQEIRQAQSGGARQTAPTPPTPPFPVISTDPQIIFTPGGGEGIGVGGTTVASSANDIPPQAVDMALGFFFTVAVIIIGLPISRAFARRMDRKAIPPQIPQEITSQLGQLTQAVDAIALEVERISEGQRFTTRLLSEQLDAARPALTAPQDR